MDGALCKLMRGAVAPGPVLTRAAHLDLQSAVQDEGRSGPADHFDGEFHKPLED